MKTFTEDQIRHAMHEWIAQYNANPDQFEPDGPYDADSQTDYLIGLMTAPK
ncbi:hypothetical protein ABEH95_004441 [Yersinia enterocolitica]